MRFAGGAATLTDKNAVFFASDLILINLSQKWATTTFGLLIPVTVSKFKPICRHSPLFVHRHIRATIFVGRNHIGDLRRFRQKSYFIEVIGIR
ncbi:Uncharacterised protein [Vibrio cholerae]|nr:Uncharacterised protein [Vibrio cholerae]